MRIRTRLEVQNLCASLIVLAVTGASAVAQPPRGHGDHAHDGRPPSHPVVDAIDQNQDREISAVEIENATENLKSLDTNNDGVLKQDELGPAGPPMEGRPPRGNTQNRPQRPEGKGRPSRENSGGNFTEQLLAFDQDNDGRLEKEELPDRMHSLIEKNDTNADGALDQAELDAMDGTGADDSQPKRSYETGQRNRTRNRQRVRTQGKTPPGSRAERFVEHAMTFDANKDGFLDEEELQEFAEQMPPPGGRGGQGGRGGAGGGPGGSPPRR